MNETLNRNAADQIFEDAEFRNDAFENLDFTPRCTSSPTPKFVDKGVQVGNSLIQTQTADLGVNLKSGDLLSFCFCDDIKNDEELSSTTGLEKMIVLDKLTKIVEVLKPPFQLFILRLTICQ